MTLTFRSVRFIVFSQWVLTLLIVAASFAIVARNALRSLDEAVSAIELVAAVIIPQISAILGYYLTSRLPDNGATISDSLRVWVILACTSVYHLIFIVLSLSLLAFSRDRIDPSAQLLVKVMGVLSPLGIAPVAALFAVSGEQDRS